MSILIVPLCPPSHAHHTRRTSYDRYYEGRKDFGTLVSHVRNLTRLIWINVSVPPLDDASRGKFPNGTLTPAQLRRRKVDAIKLSLCYAYAVKHYLRGEDGLDWDDYGGILPASTSRLFRGLYQPPNKDYRYSTNGKSTAFASYAATEFTTRTGSPEGMATGSTTPGLEMDVEQGQGRSSTADATKRIRVKRSKDKLKGPGHKATTPLMSSLQNTIDFSADPDNLSTPLPMVYATVSVACMLAKCLRCSIRSIAHELSRALFKFRRDGYLETVGPAGVNAMNTL